MKPNHLSNENIQVVDRVVASKDTGFYISNRAPLQSTLFQNLPPSNIIPGGWLRAQLNLQVNGLNGQMSEISDYLAYNNCGWIDPTKGGWEELPYWLRGFSCLGFITADQRVQQLTQKWMDGILMSQQGDGWFGPNNMRTSLEGGPDFWPAMPLIHAIRSFYEYTNDSRVLPFLTKYYQYQNSQPVAVFSRGWGNTRWADTIESIYWLYNRTGDEWLLDLVRKIHANSADYVNGIPTWHNVNLSQGFREPAEYWLLDSDQKYLQATYNDYEKVMTMYGQFPGGGFAGDENCRSGYGDPRQGFETCGIVEFMHSFEILMRLTGDRQWADRCEELAFNLLPAAFDPEQKGTHYVTCANCIQLDNQAKTQQQFDNNFPMLAYMPGVHNYRCCPHNYGMAWPYYAQELWLATSDKGLCASLYCASEVKAIVGSEAVEVRIVEETDYPFDDVIHFTIFTSKPVLFPLYLRIPSWCQKPLLQLNQKLISIQTDPSSSYLIIDRIWQDGDVIDIQLTMAPSVRTWTTNRNAVSVLYGPLIFSLSIVEKWNQIGGTDIWPEYEVIPQSDWNYGLVLTDNEYSFRIKKTKKTSDNPFEYSTTPIRIEAKARKIVEWKADSQNVVGLLPLSPVKSDQPDELVILIPMGVARLRITSFPQIG
ncbi:unnamed protein product [Didymodactylos carnosus]|uniref:Transcriptional initiation protein Tat n=1 Tax=Didymodactylos carnosus TaxID=1234261 RepID=A0A814AUG1_9BILA|nr:unnamed protein product [Didymodactylos carnosus]CAF0917763.1 unnamed protein product [Didymodactylos carnosus]CAF3543489.1 unnamed protein product [Didymodactylos carnosus]CAF3697658.1 unnamed protein product [Didymodactylos carnosus]